MQAAQHKHKRWLWSGLRNEVTIIWESPTQCHTKYHQDLYTQVHCRYWKTKAGI